MKLTVFTVFSFFSNFLVVSSDFVLGALCVVGVVLVRTVWNLFQAPTIPEIGKIANKPVRHVGSDDTITVFGHIVDEDYIPDFSPYCSRVELYLRLIGHCPTSKKV